MVDKEAESTKTSNMPIWKQTAARQINQNSGYIAEGGNYEYPDILIQYPCEYPVE